MTIITYRKELNPAEVADLGPQDKLVYEYLITGRALTNMVALVNLGVGSLSRRITTLRKAGLDISTEWGQDHFERRYKRYAITKPEGEEEADA